MIYLDNAATTPVPRAVADAMYQVLTEQFGNPSSQYPMGVEMKAAVERWRAVIAGERQLGDTGRPVAEPAQGQAHHHHRCGAQRRAGAVQMAGAAGL